MKAIMVVLLMVNAIKIIKFKYLKKNFILDFDPFHNSLLFDKSSKPEDCRITVSNVSVRATTSQLLSFFSKFGAVIF